MNLPFGTPISWFLTIELRSLFPENFYNVKNSLLLLQFDLIGSFKGGTQEIIEMRRLILKVPKVTNFDMQGLNG